jgi:hypothetical protein
MGFDGMSSVNWYIKDECHLMTIAKAEEKDDQ